MIAFKIVSKARIGKFKQKILLESVKVYICYIDRLINQTMTKVCFIEPNISNERLFDQQIKSTIGITG